MGNNISREVIIGRAGMQPFSIKTKKVSTEHAKITITEYGEWILEDLGSNNGTYILNKKGNWIKLITHKPILISEDTIIRLGGEYGNGVKFMAHRLKDGVDPKNYNYEFDEMRIRNEQFEDERRRLRNKELVRIGMLVVALLISFFPDTWIESEYVKGLINRQAILIPTLYACWIGWQGKRDKELIEKRQERFAVCPNPECNCQLDKNSQKRMMCPTCKAKFDFEIETDASINKNE
ncbi:MAG: FHA domain-containing protein [Muribaculaceae bacterium]|nr:FHA domain-containing protein [Muribaculaceae bacterium]